MGRDRDRLHQTFDVLLEQLQHIVPFVIRDCVDILVRVFDYPLDHSRPVYALARREEVLPDRAIERPDVLFVVSLDQKLG